MATIQELLRIDGNKDGFVVAAKADFDKLAAALVGIS
jgi:hypothetical protein